MEYNGYAAGPIRFDPQENTFSGMAAGIRDVIHFEGSTAGELEAAFRDSIDTYLSLRDEEVGEP
jgi:predicted HicB family RNase H-like nuclease